MKNHQPPLPADSVRSADRPHSPKLAVASIGHWLDYGWRTFCAAWPISMLFATLFAAIGLVGIFLFLHLGLVPLIYPWAGGFMLIGPALLCGYFQAARRLAAGERPGWADLMTGFRSSPPAVWVMGVLSAFLLMIWLTDAAIIYGLYFGREPVFLHWDLLSRPEMREDLWTYFVFCTLVGSVVALILFATSAFSVPLMFFQRTPLATAVTRSVRLVFANLRVMVLWGLLLTVAIVGAIILFMPLFVVLFPLLAYASEAAYREACETG
ncbi:MAG: DUF2189 domain-containing protein [Gammaproteobacteria bacterium]